MTDTRQGLAEAARALADLAKEAAYVAIGVGVLEFQKAQVRRRELACARKVMAKRARDFDATVAQVIKVVDSTLKPVLERLPEPAQAIVRQARETRDEMRTRVFGFSA
jgi:aromatic ring-opening dioxygenase catalytic subunit (LigB family)